MNELNKIINEMLEDAEHIVFDLSELADKFGEDKVHDAVNNIIGYGSDYQYYVWLEGNLLHVDDPMEV